MSLELKARLSYLLNATGDVFEVMEAVLSEDDVDEIRHALEFATRHVDISELYKEQDALLHEALRKMGEKDENELVEFLDAAEEYLSNPEEAGPLLESTSLHFSENLVSEIDDASKARHTTIDTQQGELEVGTPHKGRGNGRGE